MKHFDKKLDRYFSIFDSTIQLVRELIKEKRHPQEVLILLCARLDALASDATSEDVSNSEAFSLFVTHYGGHRQLFESVSAGDLYYELGFHRWLIEGTIPKAGRLCRFSRVDDTTIELLTKSGIPLTVRDATHLLDKTMSAIKKRYRVNARQVESRSLVASSHDIESTILGRFREPRMKEIRANLPSALAPLLRSKRLAAILYQRFRNESIHGAQVLFNVDKFFTETEPYWEGETSTYFGPYLLVEFPAQFLLNTLENCIRTFRGHILGKQKMPPDVHFHVCGDQSFQHLEWLDHELLPASRILTPK